MICWSMYNNMKFDMYLDCLGEGYVNVDISIYTFS